MTFENRFARVIAEKYHADPCAVPSLSSSIAQIIEAQSPLHAWTAHPKLGGVRREPTKALDAGSLIHALILGAGSEIEVIGADDYRTKAAQTKRDEAREAHKVPVLAKDFNEAQRVATILRQRFVDVGVVLDGESEVTALWTERSSSGAEVQCRGMMDHLSLSLPRIYDLKSTRSAHPTACQRSVDNYGYAIQHTAYTRAVGRIRPELAGRVDFVIVFFELEPPFAVTPVRLSGAFRELGARRWHRAVDRWEECLRTTRWPAYVDGITELEPPTWALARDMDRQFEEAS